MIGDDVIIVIIRISYFVMSSSSSHNYCYCCWLVLLLMLTATAIDIVGFQTTVLQMPTEEFQVHNHTLKWNQAWMLTAWVVVQIMVLFRVPKKGL